MITKTGQALLEKDASWAALGSRARSFGSKALDGMGKLWHGGRQAIGDMANLAEAGAQGAKNAVSVSRQSNAGIGQTLKDGYQGARNVMAGKWAALPGSHKAGVTAVGGLGAGYMAFGGGDQAPQYNFYQTGYPQQFSGSWQ